MQIVPVNYWAVVVCAVVSMGLGFLWYGPLFGKMWMQMMGMSKESMTEAQKKGMTKSYILMFIGSLVMAYVLSHSLTFAGTYTNTSGVAAGLMVGFWTWLGFYATTTLSDVLWGNKPWKLWFLNNGYYLAELLVFGLILALWK